ncbi:MAG TPA: hypothetical protein VFQ85_09645 [Mycobacteriales bacterium]|nr:hypothetical protein [Mycobacteriales bacterium]
MSNADQIRRRLGETQNKRLAVENKIAEARRTQSRKNEEAATYRQRAAKASSATQQSMYARQAESAERAALAEGRRIADESRKSADLLKAETTLNKDLANAIADAARNDQRAREKQARDDKQARDREQRLARDRQVAADRRAAEERRRLDREAAAARAENARRAAEHEALTRSLVADAETRIRAEIAAVRPPAAEPLKILYLTAAASGDLRVDEEIRRVKAGVRAATHRDLVQIDHLPAATSGDLLDGLARTLPHVVHFSGHADPSTVVLDTGSDAHGPGHHVAANAFAAAVGAIESVILVVLNACQSEAQLAGLLLHVPLAIGMSDSVGDRDAMAFAARFYAAVAEGQAVQTAFDLARAQLLLDGLPGADLPVLAAAAGIDPGAVRLVVPPDG